MYKQWKLCYEMKPVLGERGRREALQLTKVPSICYGNPPPLSLSLTAPNAVLTSDWSVSNNRVKLAYFATQRPLPAWQ